jgi:branched-chain amino acid transport system substrate-binding protein
MKRISALIGLLALGTGLAACGSDGSDGSDGNNGDGDSGPVKIAIVEPFSGSFGYFGDFLKNSLQYQVDKINADGGLLGRQLEVITRDDEIAAEPTVTAVRELSDDPSVGLIVGPSFSFLYNAVRPIYDEKQQLNCPLSVDSTDAVQGAKYTFRAGPYNNLFITSLLKYFQDSGTVKTVGVVYANDDTGEATDKEFADLAGDYGIDYLGAQFYNADASNQLTQFNKLKDADAIYISADAAAAAQSAISASDVGYEGILVGGDGLQSYAFVDGAGEKAAGTVFASEPLLNMTRTPESEWPSAYAAFIKQATDDYGVQTGPKSGVTQLKATPLATACIVAWAKAVEEAGTFDDTKVAEAWENLSIPAADNPAGTPVQFSPDNHDFFQDPNQVAVYQWVQDGDEWYLETLADASE